MNFDEAFTALSKGSPVYRESWEDVDRYLDSRFTSDKFPDRAVYPYSDELGSFFLVVDCSGSETGDAYTFTEEDKAATDWLLG